MHSLISDQKYDVDSRIEAVYLSLSYYLLLPAAANPNLHTLPSTLLFKMLRYLE